MENKYRFYHKAFMVVCFVFVVVFCMYICMSICNMVLNRNNQTIAYLSYGDVNLPYEVSSLGNQGSRKE